VRPRFRVDRFGPSAGGGGGAVGGDASSLCFRLSVAFDIEGVSCAEEPGTALALEGPEVDPVGCGVVLLCFWGESTEAGAFLGEMSDVICCAFDVSGGGAPGYSVTAGVGAIPLMPKPVPVRAFAGGIILGFCA
jgi:hypothetical protein